MQEIVHDTAGLETLRAAWAGRLGEGGQVALQRRMYGHQRRTSKACHEILELLSAFMELQHS